jgi:6-phosphogluconate dehydrogenase
MAEMQLGMVGLGRMGGNMVERLLSGGHEIVAFDRGAEALARAAVLGAQPAGSLAELVKNLRAPRVVWVMVPSGEATEQTIAELMVLLARGDVVIDGGNSNYRDTLRRSALLSERGIDLIDSGTSGGVWGLKNGYCLMIGANPAAFAQCEPVFATLAPPSGYARVGAPGSGHFVKMVHNGIEYGMLQAYAEGYEILNASRDFELDLAQIAALWNRGSVVRSWMNELAERAFANDAGLDSLTGYVEDSGEGRWTVQTAIDLDVPAPVITLALLMRLRSRQADTFAGKVIAALRNEFGGHAVKKV